MIDLINKVRNGMYKPKASPEIEKALETPEGQRYIQFQMHALLAQNYILNMKFRGKITDKDFEKLIELAGTEEGLQQLSSHMVLTGCAAEEPFSGINILKPEQVSDLSKYTDPNDRHLIEPANPQLPETEGNPTVLKKIKR